SIYQVAYQRHGKVFGHKGLLSFSATNLNQGWSWADSTTISNTVLLNLSSQLAMSERVSLGLEGMRALSKLSAGTGEWYYALSATLKSKIWLSAALRYDKYRYDPAAALGGTLDVMIPLGKIVNLRLNIYYRPAIPASATITTPTQLFSQQSLEAIF
ncbi:MAG: hypothetical protein AAFN92_16015, partial [Bacteroidota bacterium]